jgi:anthranilate phosphoribosyltransferase
LAASDVNGFPEELAVIAKTDDGEIMAVKHKKYNIYGLQFHPESILTPDGMVILKNFLKEEKSMIKEAIAKVSNGEDLSFEEANSVIDEIMSGEVTPAQTASFLTALHMKGETVAEISGCANAMREKATKAEHSMDVIDIVGTGGDKSQSINISTIASFVTAAAGGHVAKHGNRAASSKCGTADCLEALGANLMADPSYNEQILNEVGFNFLFAQKYHTAMKYVGPVRKEIGIPTVFNILGPIANPAKAELMLLGVYKEELVDTIAETLRNLGVKRAMVVYGQDVMDEITVGAKTSVCELKDGELTRYEINPADYGFTGYTKADLVGGTPAENAEIAKQILQGAQGAGRAAVLLNAGAALHIINQISLEEGIQLATEAIDSGKAYETMLKYVELTNKLA